MDSQIKTFCEMLLLTSRWSKNIFLIRSGRLLQAYIFWISELFDQRVHHQIWSAGYLGVDWIPTVLLLDPWPQMT